MGASVNEIRGRSRSPHSGAGAAAGRGGPRIRGRRESAAQQMGATAWCRDAATDWSPDATTVIAPLRWLVPRPIARPVLAQQPDVVDHRWSLRHWHDRAAGRDLPLYRTPGFAQWHHHAVAHTKHLL